MVYICQRTVWSQYTTYPCSITCGVGTYIRTRDCLDPVNGTKISPTFCQGECIEELQCRKEDCPCKVPNKILFYSYYKKCSTNFLFTDWSDFSDDACSVSCGKGTYTSRRRCLQWNNKTEVDSETCQGDSIRVHPCDMTVCPGA